ncbi:hypothetical protein G6045_23510 [Streptomyces sp. YC504]|uniref:Uncharacterized protein n=1 Tax=Streptomyces mesophilus TaxID=1775132 RepID=A0A6G4XLZ4_9ACTN|nr:hypothetical protein [Streptomyces mesophilus]
MRYAPIGLRQGSQAPPSGIRPQAIAGTREPSRARFPIALVRYRWLTSSAGRSLAFVTNGERAMVVLAEGPDDAGEHAVDPEAEGSSEGFVLSNGQHDEYPDRDTVRIDVAYGLTERIVATGSWPRDAQWVVDR